MSLLEQLVLSKSRLKAASTVVTRLDGTQILQTGTSSTLLTSKTPGFVVDTKPDNVPAAIVEFLYLGSQDCADLTILQEYSIKYVLSLGVPSISAALSLPGVTFKHCECLDLPETCLATILNECVDYIDAARARRANILVHCNAGVSRSAAIVIAYLIRQCDMSYSAAYSHVKRARSAIRPNDGFVKQLQQLADTVHSN